MIDREPLSLPEARRTDPRVNLGRPVEEGDREVGPVVRRGQRDAVEDAAFDVLVNGLHVEARFEDGPKRVAPQERLLPMPANPSPEAQVGDPLEARLGECSRVGPEDLLGADVAPELDQASDGVGEIVRTRSKERARDGSGGRACQDGEWGSALPGEQLGQGAQHADLVSAARPPARQREGHSHDARS